MNELDTLMHSDTCSYEIGRCTCGAALIAAAVALSNLFDEMAGDHPEFPLKISVDNGADAQRVAETLTNFTQSAHAFIGKGRAAANG